MFGLLDALTTMLCTQISINANNFTNTKFANPTPKELFHTLKTFVDQNPLIKTQVLFVSSSAPHPKPPPLFAGSNALYSILNEGTMHGHLFLRGKHDPLPPSFTKSVATFTLIGNNKGIGLSIFSNECNSSEETSIEGVPFHLCINIPTLDEMYNKKCWYHEENLVTTNWIVLWWTKIDIGLCWAYWNMTKVFVLFIYRYTKTWSMFALFELGG